MAKQRIGPAKHAKCERISGASYRVCYMNGARLTHGLAECWRDGVNADLVQLRTAEWRPYVRQGQHA